MNGNIVVPYRQDVNKKLAKSEARLKSLEAENAKVELAFTGVGVMLATLAQRLAALEAANATTREEVLIARSRWVVLLRKSPLWLTPSPHRQCNLPKVKFHPSEGWVGPALTTRTAGSWLMLGD